MQKIKTPCRQSTNVICLTIQLTIEHGMNCVGSTYTGIFNTCTVFHQQLGVHGCRGQNACTDLYHFIWGDLSIHGYGYLQGVLEPIPCRYRAATKVSLASKFIRGFFTVQGDGTLKSLTVQRSTVYSVSIQNIYLVFLVFTTPKNFRLKFSIKLFSIKLFYLI